MNIFIHECEGASIHHHFVQVLLGLLPEPLRSHCNFPKLPPQFATALDSIDPETDIYDLLFQYLGEDSSNYRVLVATLPDSALAKWCMRQASHAKWGCSILVLSVDYSPNSNKLGVQLHEALHLFGVDDCYSVETFQPKETCDDPACIMRYTVPSLKICNGVKKQLERFEKNG